MKLCVYIAVTGVTLLHQADAISQDHRFSVKDDIAMVRFSDPSPEPNIPSSNVARCSPDGRYIAVVTTKGLLESDRIESEVIVFRLKEISDFLQGRVESPKPRVIAAIVSFPHREQTVAYAPVIKDLRWSADMTSVYFRGENLQGAYQLYLAKLDGSGFRALSPAHESIDRFDIVGRTILYKSSEFGKDEDAPTDAINRDARAVTGLRIQDVIFPDQLHTIQPETFTLSVLKSNGHRWVRRHIPNYSSRDLTYLSALFPFALSPKGTQLIAITPVLSLLDSWKHFEPATGFEHLRLANGGDSRVTSADNATRPQQYSLIDLKNGNTTPLVDAPNARSLA